MKVFHHLFKLTKPFSKDKQQWLSFRANQNMKVFKMLEESVRDFKTLYFKVLPLPGTAPFWVNEVGKGRFPLSWNESWLNIKLDREELSESELLFVDTLTDCWGKKPHLQTRNLLTQPSTYIQKDILGVMSGKSSVYDKFKAHLLNKSKKSVQVGGTVSGLSKPSSSDQSVPTSSAVPDSGSTKNASATPSPSIQSVQEVDKSNQEPPLSRKRKAPKPKYGHINSKEFDHTGFAEDIKAAAICQAAQNKMKGCVIVPEGEVEKLRNRVKVVEVEKRVIEGEKSELSSKVRKLEAQLALKTQDLKDAQESLKKAEKGRLDLDKKCKRLYAEYRLKVEDQKRLEGELQAAEDLCHKFSSDAMILAEEVAENLKSQLQVLIPEFDVNQINPDHKVIDGIVVPPEPPADVEEHADVDEDEITPEPISVIIPESNVVPTSEDVPLSENSPEVPPLTSDLPQSPPS
ncbi:hypothetical protein PIB30_032021 [Stylosanthes scabra]|uniref:Uncharacterized protein n=1 Tax=Stylosanthes scabra TaxID=79078 RepID=A0ABU6WCA6_9FABA|nr:hypothetical protein [Stylosanthes scabra]